MKLSATTLRVAAVILLCGVAAACGRKGPLEAPPEATAPPPSPSVSPQSPDGKASTDVPSQNNTP